MTVKLRDVMNANDGSYHWRTPAPDRLHKIHAALGGPHAAAGLMPTATLKALFSEINEIHMNVDAAIRTDVDQLKQHQRNYEAVVNDGIERYEARDRSAVQAFTSAREEKKEQQKILKDLGGVTKMARDWTNHALHDLEKFRKNSNLNTSRVLAWLKKVDQL